MVPSPSGTTGAAEGNLLVSDKEPGPELELALHSTRLWQELAQELPAHIEYEAKGGLVVASDATAMAALREFAAHQAEAGVTAEEISADRLSDLEPHLAPPGSGAASTTRRTPRSSPPSPRPTCCTPREPGCAPVRRSPPSSPARAARCGACAPRPGSCTPRTWSTRLSTWSGEVARLAGAHLPVLPRRGFVLVTEPLPRVVRRKVYAADYVADVASGSAALQTSAVVEGTPAGPVLIGASRERVGFDRTLSTEVLRHLAAQATALFPVLAGVRAMRTYAGFRPYLPDHLPAIGSDPPACPDCCTPAATRARGSASPRPPASPSPGC
ncbi:FAD-dependent oxidoreductase [Streptomyces olivoverticillatus]